MSVSIEAEALELHRKLSGKVVVRSQAHLRRRKDLSLLYTPGVAAATLAVAREPAQAYTYTAKGNSVAIVTDGSAVLGLGNVGPEAALPVMEGKALLFCELAGISAFPICLDTQDPFEIIETTCRIAPVFGGINLEDIASPQCFEIEEALQRRLDIPVMHDDQHGTAVVVLAGLINALKVKRRPIDSLKVVICGAGAAGIAVGRILLGYGFRNIVLVDTRGTIVEGRKGLNPAKQAMARVTNPQKEHGSLADAVEGADAFIGVSVGNVLTKQMVTTMREPIVFAMANPEPEIYPAEALAGGATVVATGRSDFPNQINNVLGFPGIFRGALAVRARQITEEMKLAAAHAIAEMVPRPSPKRIIPSPLDKRVVPVVARAVAAAAESSGAATDETSGNHQRWTTHRA
ncbi:MAG: NAD-dependent malic enzyme [Dehalococcoidia bacterium]|nr:NAD-dependent malic enzyme [Dehalococcoidia bacterium]